jgi:hypothetical protein
MYKHHFYICLLTCIFFTTFPSLDNTLYGYLYFLIHCHSINCQTYLIFPLTRMHGHIWILFQ